MTGDSEQTASTSTVQSAPARSILADVITRTTGPATTNGRQWEVQLSAIPPRDWLEFFKSAGGASAPPAFSPPRVVFDRASATFTSDADHVERWIAAIDTWMARTNTRYRDRLDEVSQERSTRMEAEAQQRLRIQQLNDRFKNL
jgi:hypothetical protein